MTAVFTIGQAVDTAVLLKLDDVADSLLLNRGQFFWLRRAVCDGIPLLDELIRTEQ